MSIRGRNIAQPGGQVIGGMVYMLSLRTFLPPERISADPNRSHAHIGRRLQVAGHILKHNCALWAQIKALYERLIDFWLWLGDVITGDYVKNSFKMLTYSKAFHDPQGVSYVCIGKDDFPSWKFFQGLVQDWVGLQHLNVNIVNVVKKCLGIDVVAVHQAAQGRAIVPEVFFLYFEGFTRFHIKEVGNKRFHSHINLSEQFGRGAIKRII